MGQQEEVAESITVTRRSSRRVSFRDEPEPGESSSSLDFSYLLDELTEEEEKKKWFTAVELQEIWKECQESIRRRREQDTVDEDADDDINQDDLNSSLRGLELVIGQENDNSSYYRRRQEWTRAVIKEQERLRKEQGTVDSNALASVVLPACEHRQRIAHLRGVKDAHAVYGTDFLVATDRSKLNEAIRDRRRTKRTERRSRAATTRTAT